ncbi:MAG: glucodextranase DOMON-like domain-containing protein [Elusimicrobiota bacterium]
MFREKSEEVKEEITGKDVFLTVSLQYKDTGKPDEFYRKILGPWQKPVNLLQNKKNNFYATLNISYPVIEQLKKLEKKQLKLPSLITDAPDRLDESQINNLTGKYDMEPDTNTIINYQVEEALSYFGDFLLKTEPINEIVEKSSYTVSDKNAVLEFMEEKLLNFEQTLVDLLDRDNIGEATTSLSDAYLEILNEKRIRAQIMESLISYKKWRGNFPSGFIPRKGYSGRESIDLLERTSLKWVTVLSTTTTEYINTTPQIIFTDSYFYNNHKATAVIDMAGRLPREMSPISIICELTQLESFLNANLLNYINFEEFKENISSYNEKSVDLSTASFTLVGVNLEGRLGKIKSILEEIYPVIEEYKNSGRGRLDNLKKAQEKLLKVESGLLQDNLEKIREDRFFRNNLLDIYRLTENSPPGKYFLPIIEKEPAIPDKKMTKMVNVKSDGVVSEDEWDGALKLEKPVKGIEQIYTGMDKDNLYFMMEISTRSVNKTGVLMGFTSAGSPALMPRFEDKITVDNIQDFPIYIEARWRLDNPSKINIYRASGNKSWEHLTGHYDVEFKDNYVEFTVPFKYMGVNANERIYFKFYRNKEIFPEENYHVMTAPEFGDTNVLASYVDPSDDNYGPGNYEYPEKLEEKKSNFDFRGIQLERRKKQKVVRIEMGQLDNSREAPYGFSYPAVDLYIDINDISGSGSTELLPNRKAYTTSEDAWEYCISVSGWHKAIYNTSFEKIGEPEVSVSPFENKINIFIPDEIISASLENFNVIPVVLAFDDEKGEVQNIEYDDTKSTVTITGRREESDTNILDVILPSGASQGRVLGGNRWGGAIEIPALKLRK